MSSLYLLICKQGTYVQLLIYHSTCISFLRMILDATYQKYDFRYDIHDAAHT